MRRGYDALSVRYEEWFGSATKYQPWLAGLRRRIPAGATVLDLGCGSGVPVASTLTDAGHRVVGVDISGVQVRRARHRVPAARFVQADVTTMRFPPETFDAVVSLYALIHIPVAEQPPLLAEVARWLRPGGWFLRTTGHTEWTGGEDNWLDGGAAMWWSHADAGTYRRWLTDAGLTVEQQQFVPEGANGGHALFWAQRTGDATGSART